MFLRQIIPAIITTALLAGFLQWWLPWWVVVPTAFVVAAIFNHRSTWQAFIGGFWGVGLLWWILSFGIDISSLYLLSSKVAELFGMPAIMPSIITGLVGGISGGLGAASGNLFRRIFSPVQQRSSYYNQRRW